MPHSAYFEDVPNAVHLLSPEERTRATVAGHIMSTFGRGASGFIEAFRVVHEHADVLRVAAGDQFMLWVAAVLTTHGRLFCPDLYSDQRDILEAYFAEQESHLMTKQQCIHDASADDLDRLWILFSATFNQKYADKVFEIGCMDPNHPVGQAAFWSHASHSEQGRIPDRSAEIEAASMSACTSHATTVEDMEVGRILGRFGFQPSADAYRLVRSKDQTFVGLLGASYSLWLAGAISAHDADVCPIVDSPSRTAELRELYSSESARLLSVSPEAYSVDDADRLLMLLASTGSNEYAAKMQTLAQTATSHRVRLMATDYYATYTTLSSEAAITSSTTSPVSTAGGAPSERA